MRVKKLVPKDRPILVTNSTQKYYHIIIMKTSKLIRTFILLFSFLPSAALASEKSRKPNIIFFLVDDLGWSDVGCYGSTFHETPNIDQLADEGIRFDNAYSTCHVCSPSRASILTGKYPARIDLTEWLGGRPERNYEKLHLSLIHI